jgi:hypothetical protein
MQAPAIVKKGGERARLYDFIRAMVLLGYTLAKNKLDSTTKDELQSPGSPFHYVK